MLQFFKRFLTDEQGLETVEYAVIGGLIIIGTVVTVGALATAINGKLQQIIDNMNGD